MIPATFVLSTVSARAGHSCELQSSRAQAQIARKLIHRGGALVKALYLFGAPS